MRLTSPAQVAPAAEQKDGKAGAQDEQGPPPQPTAPGKGKAGSLKRSRTMAVLELARSINVANIPASAMEEYKVLFDTMDDDKSGTLEPHELRMQFHRVGIDIDSADLRSLLRALDVDGSGAIDADGGCSQSQWEDFHGRHACPTYQPHSCLTSCCRCLARVSPCVSLCTRCPIPRLQSLQRCSTLS